MPWRPEAPHREEFPLAEYRIDDLARLTGTTVRSLRALHDRGLLAPPVLKARTGFYDDEHLARARMVLSLQKRGFTLPAVAQLLTAWESGQNISQILGLDEDLTTSSGPDVPERTTIGELEARLGLPLPTELVVRLVRNGLLAPDAEGEYTMPAPALIEAGVQMVRSGISLERVLELSESLRADMFAIAARLTRSVGDDLISDDSPEGLPVGDLQQLLSTIATLRRQAEVSIAGWFRLGMDQAVSDYVASMGDRAVVKDA